MTTFPGNDLLGRTWNKGDILVWVRPWTQQLVRFHSWTDAGNARIEEYSSWYAQQQGTGLRRTCARELHNLIKINVDPRIAEIFSILDKYGVADAERFCDSHNGSLSNLQGSTPVFPFPV